MTPEELAEAEKSLPVIANRKDRLSVSKSGRHKLKGKQRGNIDNSTYATVGSISQNPAPNHASSSSRVLSNSNTNSMAASTSGSQGSRVSGGNQGSLGRNSQQGSLGRSQGGHCAVAQKSTDSKRGYGGQKSIPKFQTAV